MKKRAGNTDYDVILIGYGPVGKILALLLDRMGWKVGVFERWQEVYPLPRAVCIDHEIFRVIHAAGLGSIVDKVTDPAPVYRWFNAEWKELLTLDWTTGSISGGPGAFFVHQPSFERELDAEVKRRNGIELFFSAEAVALEQGEDIVTITIRDGNTEQTSSYTGLYLVGVDGANSFVRDAVGITRTDLGFEADWLVVDFTLRDDLTATDLGLPECGQYCNPKRPTTIVPGGTDDGRVCRRWEFMRLPHETREEMVEEAKVRELLGDWIKPEQGELVRHALYTFRSLIADQWRRHRVLLAGDAAHLMPPFMGQGMCAGLRDAWNLAWKLDSVMSGAAGAALLDTYQLERRPHVTDVVRSSIWLGSIICIPDEQAAAERDERFLSGNAPPMPPFPILTDGFLAKDESGALMAPAGKLSPHGTVRHKRRTGRFDSFIPPDLVLVLTEDLLIGELSAAARSVLEDLHVRIVTVSDRRAASDEQFADTQGQILPFMAQCDINAMLLRPDHYLFGGAKNVRDLEKLVAELARQSQQYGLLGRS